MGISRIRGKPNPNTYNLLIKLFGEHVNDIMNTNKL